MADLIGNEQETPLIAHVDSELRHTIDDDLTLREFITVFVALIFCSVL
jgi:hypothetical protein